MAIQVDPRAAQRRRTAIATYETEAEAVAALRALHEQGLERQHIRLVARDAGAVERVSSTEGINGTLAQGEAEMFSYREHRKGRPELIGALAGALIAVLLGLGALAIPGFGNFLMVAGPLAILYTSSCLIATAWLSVIWLVTLGFGLLYAYKFGWDHLRPTHPRLHAALGLAAAGVLLVVPLIYLTNTQLMLVPTAWDRQPGFFEAMAHVGNVGPRYLHFMLASLAIAGFWVALWLGRPAGGLPEDVRARARRVGVGWALVPTALQFVAGPLVLFTLPAGATTAPMLAVLGVGVLAGALAIFALADSWRGADRVGRAALLLVVTVACMGTVRHLVRETLLHPSVDARTVLRSGVILADMKFL